MGSVVAIIVTMLLLLRFLDDPFHSGVGGLQPQAMERTEQLIDQQLAALGGDVPIPCDAQGPQCDDGRRARRGVTARSASPCRRPRAGCAVCKGTDRPAPRPLTYRRPTG